MAKSKLFPESALAHKYLDGLHGLQIGGSLHNEYGLSTVNLDNNVSMETVYKLKEIELCGEALGVDIVCEGDNLSVVCSDTFDFVISSHVLEHFRNPIQALREWYRVTKPGGYILTTVPHVDRTFDKGRKVTSWGEFVSKDIGRWTWSASDKQDDHHSVWNTYSFLRMHTNLVPTFHWKVVCHLDVDDKVGNGCTVLVQLPGEKTNGQLVF